MFVEAVGADLIAVEIAEVARVGRGMPTPGPTAPSSLAPSAKASLWNFATAARFGATKLTVTPLPQLAGKPFEGFSTKNSGADSPQIEPFSPKSVRRL